MLRAACVTRNGWHTRNGTHYDALTQERGAGARGAREGTVCGRGGFEGALKGMWSQGVTVENFVVEEGNREKLKKFLTSGGVKLEGWNENSFVQLEKELLKGEASLHKDGEGNAVRVVSVAKPVIYDPGDHTVLIEAFQTFGAAGTEKTKVKCSGMSEKFNPLEESCQVACARAMEEELKFRVDVAEFCANSQLVKTLAPSQKFVSLKSEYHLWYCMLSQQAVLSLQAKIPKMKMTGVDETDHSTNPKTLWWAWCPSLSVREVQRHLTRLTESTPFAGDVDFAAELKLGTPGEQVRDEAMMGKWWTAAAPQWQRDLLFKPQGTVSSAATKCAEGATPQSRRLPECRADAVESAPEVNVNGFGHFHRPGGSRLRTHRLARSSRHAAVWSLRTLDDDRGPLLTAGAQVLRSMGEDSSSPEAHRYNRRRKHLEPRPSRPHVLCCATGR